MVKRALLLVLGMCMVGCSRQQQGNPASVAGAGVDGGSSGSGGSSNGGRANAAAPQDVNAAVYETADILDRAAFVSIVEVLGSEACPSGGASCPAGRAVELRGVENLVGAVPRAPWVEPASFLDPLQRYYGEQTPRILLAGRVEAAGSVAICGSSNAFIWEDTSTGFAFWVVSRVDPQVLVRFSCIRTWATTTPDGGALEDLPGYATLCARSLGQARKEVAASVERVAGRAAEETMPYAGVRYEGGVTTVQRGPFVCSSTSSGGPVDPGSSAPLRDAGP